MSSCHIDRWWRLISLKNIEVECDIHRIYTNYLVVTSAQNMSINRNHTTFKYLLDCVYVWHTRKKSLICFIFTICYILRLDFDRIFDGILRLSHSCLCAHLLIFCELNTFFFRAERSLEPCRQGCGPFVCANTTIIFALSACALVLVYLILFELFLEHHHFLSMDSNELFLHVSAKRRLYVIP